MSIEWGNMYSMFENGKKVRLLDRQSSAYLDNVERNKKEVERYLEKHQKRIARLEELGFTREIAVTMFGNKIVKDINNKIEIVRKICKKQKKQAPKFEL